MRPPPIDSAALPPLASAGAESPRPRRTFLQVLETRDEGAPRPPQGPASSQPTLPAGAATGPGAAAGLRALMMRALDAEDRLDRMMASAAAGKTFSAGQLLALQATAFRYAQTVEVLSRAADRLVGSIKQTLGTPV